MNVATLDLELDHPIKLPEPDLRGDPITGDRYTSRDYFQKEWARMWMRTWQIGCLSYEIPSNGDFARASLGKESILLVRQADGTARAFYNVCQHRGARLTADENGSAASGFSCPYHGWCFSADGALKFIPDADDYPGGSPKGKIRLVELACDEFMGFVWFNMDPSCPPLKKALGTAGEELSGYRIENMIRVLNMTADANCNWKIITDNFNEAYHIPVLHPELVPYIEACHSECQFDLREHGSNSGWFPAQRPPSSYRGDKPTEDVAAMMQQWDLNPDDYCGNDKMAQIRIDIQKQKRKLGPDRGYTHYNHLSNYQLTDYTIYNIFPNNVFSAGPDGVQLLRPRPHPTDPEKCLFDHWYMVPKISSIDKVPSPAGGPDLPMEHAELERFAYGEKTLGTTADQDLSISEVQQEGVGSVAYQGANLLNQERRIQYFHEVLNDYVDGRR